MEYESYVTFDIVRCTLDSIILSISSVEEFRELDAVGINTTTPNARICYFFGRCTGLSVVSVLK